MEFIGWTHNKNTEDPPDNPANNPAEILAEILADIPAGTLQSETRYITQLNVSNEFGSEDERTATDMVGSIVVTIIR